MSHALLVIDIQRDYFPGGKVELHEPEAAARNAASLLGGFREMRIPVVHVQHRMPPERGVPFLLEGTEGQKIHLLVAPLEGEGMITKEFPNAFRGTPLLGQLQALETTHLVICGMMTHMCVDFTAKAAFDLGFRVTVVGDATATCALPYGSRTLPADVVRDAHLAALDPIVATVVTTEEVLKMLAQWGE